ncbi:2-aminoethylphosphonate--pyruvate transaminase [Nitrincola iocasae]|uniref:2-aminoethylphosphonate--pyruvate transaminase n=1 Tax=Nitrincola iocasae TaxID=2614693 RepID=A0A5J6LHX5_9GAMM|nr:2-aminoethylphosphonate--pyruvate transaminase [Nitrincola iocasae]QEW08237.1 2-aminoethylphosphonate--pyruvate transaminase [Nitrincola iocasae]
MHNEPYLLTPGPLTTSLSVKQAMLRDWGSWDGDFNQITAAICQDLLTLANAQQTHVCVPLQGSGTYLVEAVFATLLAKDSKTLVLMNGAYGQRAAAILQRMGKTCVTLDKGDYQPPLAQEVDELLRQDPLITHVVVIHCETSSGILNPVDAIAKVVAAQGRELIIDSMSAFGALPVDANELPFTALVSSANKCLEGVPGFGFALIRETALVSCEGQSPSLSLDLYDQWRYMQKTGQWRFTPPTHVVAAFHQALQEYQLEGGQSARLARYSRNRDRLVAGMRALGFQTLLEDAWLSPIIITFLSPDDPAFSFMPFYQQMKSRGFLIYPGKLTQVESFRLGCIGQLFDSQINAVLEAVADSCTALGLTAIQPPQTMSL